MKVAKQPSRYTTVQEAWNPTLIAALKAHVFAEGSVRRVTMKRSQVPQMGISLMLAVALVASPACKLGACCFVRLVGR